MVKRGTCNDREGIFMSDVGTAINNELSQGNIECIKNNVKKYAGPLHNCAIVHR